MNGTQTNYGEIYKEMLERERNEKKYLYSTFSDAELTLRKDLIEESYMSAIRAANWTCVREDARLLDIIDEIERERKAL